MGMSVGVHVDLGVVVVVAVDVEDVGFVERLMGGLEGNGGVPFARGFGEGGGTV